MLHWMLLVLFCSSLKFIEAQQKELPEYIEKCSFKKDLKQCMIRTANKAIPFITKGDPEYDIPNMQPIHIPFIPLINTPMLVLNFSGNEIYGLDDAKLVDVIIDEDNPLLMNPIFKNPNITLKGSYSVSGNVMALELNGKGNYTVSLLRGVYKYPLLLEKVTIDGVDYYQTRGKNLVFDFEDVVFDIGDLFGGDAEFGRTVNKLLNENWRTLLDEFSPAIADMVTKVISDIFNRLAKYVPAKNVFLPD